MYSIIIPLYNKEAYIDKAVKSVLIQTYIGFELIIIDDGSTDNSLLEVQKFDDQRIRIIIQQNQGVSTARNNGVKAAKYDYVAFLDADDWWEPTYLEEMKTLLEEFPKTGIFGSGYYIIKNGHKHIAPIGVEKDFKKGFINYCQVYSNALCMPLWTGATVVRKSVFIAEKGFKPRLKFGEDFDLWLRVSLKYQVVLLNKPLSNYNQDVDLKERAVGSRLYEPKQHMLFSDYSEFSFNADFTYLFECLAVYSLLPYYLANKNISDVKNILSNICWKNHSYKYRLYYQILPKKLVIYWMNYLKLGSKIKRRLKILIGRTNE